MMPRFETRRLVLRTHRLADFERWAEFFASDRSRLLVHDLTRPAGVTP